jgi:hypothetical protein
MLRIVLSEGKHRDIEVVFLRFDGDEALINQIRSNYDARWSATKRMWYVPASEFELNGFMRLMKGLAWVDYSGFREKKLIAKGVKKKTIRNHSKFIADKETSYKIPIGKAA